MDYYLTIKRNKVLIKAAILTNIEKIMLSERNQTQKITYTMIPFI